jgi:hypothetical protein
LIHRIVHYGDGAMAALELARSLQREFDHSVGLLSDTMTQLGHGYGGPVGVAHAAEIAPAQHEQFTEYWVAGELALPPRPPPAPRTPSRWTWAREPFEYFDERDARDNPEAPASSNAPGGDPGQGSSRRDCRDTSMPPVPADDSGDEREEVENVLDPPSPPAPYNF